MDDKTHGTFVKYTPAKVITRVARSAAEAVQLRFDGWQEQSPLPTKPARTAN